MSLDDIDISEWSEGASGSKEGAPEMSDKQKEKAKKAQAQLQKTQKDEKKAQRDNDALFAILLRFIQNPLYEELIPVVSKLLEETFSSRYILSVISLFFGEAALYIANYLGRHDDLERYTHIHTYPNRVPFDDKTIDPSIREWITLWLSDTERFLAHQESSTILHQKLLTLISGPKRVFAREALSMFFIFFLHLRNVEIDTKKATVYAEYILSVQENSLKKFLEHADGDLKASREIESSMLF